MASKWTFESETLDGKLEEIRKAKIFYKNNKTIMKRIERTEKLLLNKK